jgi:hypothetical protein
LSFAPARSEKFGKTRRDDITRFVRECDKVLLPQGKTALKTYTTKGLR